MNNKEQPPTSNSTPHMTISVLREEVARSRRRQVSGGRREQERAVGARRPIGISTVPAYPRNKEPSALTTNTDIEVHVGLALSEEGRRKAKILHYLNTALTLMDAMDEDDDDEGDEDYQLNFQ